MKRNKYIKPEIQVIRLTVVPQLLSGSDGGHSGGDPDDTPDDPPVNQAKPVGSAGYHWFEEEESRGSSSHNLWD